MRDDTESERRKAKRARRTVVIDAPVVRGTINTSAVQHKPNKKSLLALSQGKKHFLNSALDGVVYAPLRFLVECLSVPFIWVPYGIGRGLWAIWFMVPTVYIALSIAAGDWSLPVEAASWVSSWAYHHTALLYFVFRILCGIFVIIAAIAAGVIIYELIVPPKPQTELKSANPAYGAAAIDNFRDKSAYGDAQHARRADIANALAGSGGVDEPFYEQ